MSGKFWTEEEKAELVRLVDSAIEASPMRTISSIFEELTGKFNRSASAINYTYYKSRAKNEPRKVYSKALEEPKEDIVLTSLGDLVEGLSAMDGLDTAAFIRGFSTIVKRASGSRVAELETVVDELRREREDLKTQLESESMMKITSEDVVKELKDKLSLIFKLTRKFHSLEPSRQLKYISNLTWGIGCIITDKEWKVAEPLKDYSSLDITIK